jgi:hypothetical protein
MNVGDLVKLKIDDGPLGFVMRIDAEHFGAGKAFKLALHPRGHCVNSNEAGVIAPTRFGIRDRVLVLWSGERIGWEYCESTELDVVSESR